MNKELRELVNYCYYQGTCEGSEYSCGINEDKIEAIDNYLKERNQIVIDGIKSLKDNIIDYFKDESGCLNGYVLEKTLNENINSLIKHLEDKENKNGSRNTRIIRTTNRIII